jgi:hypothetical protein
MKLRRNDRGFGFLEWHHGSNSRYSLRVWVNQDIPVGTDESGKDEIAFPVVGAQLVKTEKGGLVLRPGDGVVYLYSVSSGYRGSSGVEMVSGGEIMANVKGLHSGQGSLGNTTVALVNGGSGPVDIRWYRTGRRVDKATGISRLTSDGEVEAVIDDPEICELMA